MKKIITKIKGLDEELILFLPDQICADMGLKEYDDVDITINHGALIIEKAS